VVWLPEDQLAGSAGLEDAVRNHFLRERRRVEQDLRQHGRDARRSLAFGAAFLVACFTAARFVGRAREGDLWSTVVDGLVILGRIALWRPGEMILYDWIPRSRRRKLYGQLARMRVETRALPLGLATGDGQGVRPNELASRRRPR
jgi:hypothetical protein